MEEFDLEGLPLVVLANWRGFSGGQRDLFEGVLQVNILDAQVWCYGYVPQLWSLPSHVPTEHHLSIAPFHGSLTCLTSNFPPSVLLAAVCLSQPDSSFLVSLFSFVAVVKDPE
jgi:Carboxyl transferase domain